MQWRPQLQVVFSNIEVIGGIVEDRKYEYGLDPAIFYDTIF